MGERKSCQGQERETKCPRSVQGRRELRFGLDRRVSERRKPGRRGRSGGGGGSLPLLIRLGSSSAVFLALDLCCFIFCCFLQSPG